ncbi:hypothetical protein [Pseudooceanicola lipolyticus]|nr:hypothetical protein [Pseudooceanicola lipolyticus]
MKRRTFLAGSAVSVLPGAAAKASERSRILQPFHQHQHLLKAADCAGRLGMTDIELDARFFDPADEIEAEMMALPCTCAADFAAKAIVDTVRGGVFSDWETGSLWVEARALTGP